MLNQRNEFSQMLSVFPSVQEQMFLEINGTIFTPLWIKTLLEKNNLGLFGGDERIFRRLCDLNF